MGGNTKIEWTEQTWNPIVGCSIVSPGCTNCYAMKMAARIQKMNRTGGSGSNYVNHYDGTTRSVNGNIVWTGKPAKAPRNIFDAPLSRKKPTTYFVNSMGDLFHEDVPDEWILDALTVMAIGRRHTFQVLTKRAARMREFMSRPDLLGDIYANWYTFDGGAREVEGWPLPNVWLGVSTERQQEADERIRDLLNTPAAIRFVSAEPLLGEVRLDRICILPKRPGSIRAGIHLNALAGRYCESGVPYTGEWDITKAPPEIPPIKLDWVIAGGESGPNARPMHPDWARSLRDQCQATGVPFFFKQWGEWAPNIGAVDGWAIDDNLEISKFAHREWEDGRWSADFYPMWCDFSDGNYNEAQCVSRLGKTRAGRKLDGVEHDAMPPRAAHGT